jgi:hypothetical protein
MRSFLLVAAVLLGLAPVLSPVSARAGVLSELLRDFAGFQVTPNQTQYAVAFINSSNTAFLWPQPTPNNVTSTNPPRNWVYGHGTPGTDNHAEATIAAALPSMIAAYPAAFGDAVTRVSVYSHYTPCNQCTVRLVSAIPAGVRLDFGFTEQWANDANTFDAIVNLQRSGARIYRVCDAAVDCRTFQRVLHTCAMGQPIICVNCENRGGGIAGFINTTMRSVKSKAPASWQAAISANHSNLEVQAQSIAAWNECLTQAQAYPVTGAIGDVDNVDPTGSPMPTNWNKLSPPGPGCGPAAFDPRSGKFTGCSPKAMRRPPA